MRGDNLFALAHVLFGKPVSTFPRHALVRARLRIAVVNRPSACANSAVANTACAMVCASNTVGASNAVASNAAANRTAASSAGPTAPAQA
jgi:hypothetical protein